MEFDKLIADRYSVRKFKKDNIAQNIVDKIIDAGHKAPTGCNNQPQRIIVVNNELSMDKLRKCTKCHFDAPAAMIVCYNIDESWVTDAHPYMPQYLDEQYPHIVFTPYLRMLEKEITGGKGSPLTRARRIYEYITHNVKYSYMREYRYLDNIPMYAALNHRGDCGVQALLFITLCRISGIPARWQSGNYIRPDHIGSHDWAQFYVAPYGWLQCDPSFGGGAYRIGDDLVHDFYFCHADPFRYISCTEFQMQLSPAKKFMRLDPYDNQSGEAEYDDMVLNPDDVCTWKEVVDAEEK